MLIVMGDLRCGILLDVKTRARGARNRVRNPLRPRRLLRHPLCAPADLGPGVPSHPRPGRPDPHGVHGRDGVVPDPRGAPRRALGRATAARGRNGADGVRLHRRRRVGRGLRLSARAPPDRRAPVSYAFETSDDESGCWTPDNFSGDLGKVAVPAAVAFATTIVVAKAT